MSSRRRQCGAGAAWVRLDPAYRGRDRNQRLVRSARELLLLLCWSGLVRPTWLRTGEQDGGGPGSVRPWAGGTGCGTALTLLALRGGATDNRGSFFEDEGGGVPGNAFAATRSGGAIQIDSLGVSHKPLGAAARPADPADPVGATPLSVGSVADVEGVVVGGGPVAGAKVAATARVEAGGGPRDEGSWLAAGEEGGGSEELLGGGRRRVRGRSRRGGSAAHGGGTDADSYYKAVMALNPSDVGIMCEYAETLARSGALRVGDAEDVLMRALRLRPESAMVLGRYGSFLEQHKGDVPQAELLYLRAIDADPDRYMPLARVANTRLHPAVPADHSRRPRQRRPNPQQPGGAGADPLQRHGAGGAAAAARARHQPHRRALAQLLRPLPALLGRGQKHGRRRASLPHCHRH